MAYILLTQQMLDAIKHITDDIFLFQEDSALVHMHCACNTVQLRYCSALDFSHRPCRLAAPGWTH